MVQPWTQTANRCPGPSAAVRGTVALTCTATGSVVKDSPAARRRLLAWPNDDSLPEPHQLVRLETRKSRQVVDSVEAATCVASSDDLVRETLVDAKSGNEFRRGR